MIPAPIVEIPLSLLRTSADWRKLTPLERAALELRHGSGVVAAAERKAQFSHVTSPDTARALTATQLLELKAIDPERFAAVVQQGRTVDSRPITTREQLRSLSPVQLAEFRRANPEVFARLVNS